jgi:exodeoxyribonuclease V alpha subunit
VSRPNEVFVEGEVQRVTFETKESSFRVIKLAVAGKSEKLAVVGSFQRVAVGARIRVRGTMVTDRKHGEQLQAVSVTEILPTTLEGVERYLGSGIVPGIGEKLARRIVSKFGVDTLRVLEEQPQRLGEIAGLGQKRAAAVAKAWGEQQGLRDAMVFLQGHDVSAALATRIWKRFGASTIDVVTRNPYALALEVWGIGFLTADRLAVALGLSKDSPERLRAGLYQVLHDATEAGHIYTPASELVALAAKLLELDGADPSNESRLHEATLALGVSGHAVTELVGPDRLVFEGRMYAAERRLARRASELANAVTMPVKGPEEAVNVFERQARVELAEEQRAAVLRAAEAPVLVITGGPGVGKTTIVKAILTVFDRAGIVTRLAAPTGRAAKRMSEATGREATTLHRLLEFDPKHGSFKRDAKRPVVAGAIIVDEVSMVDLLLADALFQATEVGTRLVLVGDVDQLPSVGPGAVLRDVIASERVPCVRLSRIFRQARESLIVVNAHRINAGEPPLAPPPGEDSDFFVIERRDPEAAKRTILELVTKRIPAKFGLDPVRDVSVLTPMHRGPAGTIALNEALQLALNPEGASITRRGRVFRVGDKVMQLKNDHDRGVYNGDVGIVLAVNAEEGSLTVGYDSLPAHPALGAPLDRGLSSPKTPKTQTQSPKVEREVVYDASNLDELTLGYAQSIHKSQGSEYGGVVIPLLTSHFVMLSRNLLYTAVTRGKRLVVLVCDPRATALALSLDRRDERRSRLALRIQEAFD